MTDFKYFKLVVGSTSFKIDQTWEQPRNFDKLLFTNTVTLRLVLHLRYTHQIACQTWSNYDLIYRSQPEQSGCTYNLQQLFFYPYFRADLTCFQQILLLSIFYMLIEHSYGLQDPSRRGYQAHSYNHKGFIQFQLTLTNLTCFYKWATRPTLIHTRTCLHT